MEAFREEAAAVVEQSWLDTAEALTETSSVDVLQSDDEAVEEYNFAVGGLAEVIFDEDQEGNPIQEGQSDDEISEPADRTSRNCA